MDAGTGRYSRNNASHSSRLPMPRASQDNLKLARSTTAPNLHQKSLAHHPQLLQPSKSYSSRITPPAALSESINSSFKTRYGWNDPNPGSRSTSPVRDALQSVNVPSLEKTPPTSLGKIPVFEDGDENPSIMADAADDIDMSSANVVLETQVKRKPRLSLAERTTETLSQLPPSPSPRSRRSSIFSNDCQMGPPGRPASRMKNTRPSTPLTPRPSSPNKQPFKPPGRTSPGPEKVRTPIVPSPGSLHAPQKAFMRHNSSGISKLHQGSRSVSSTAKINGDEPQIDYASFKRGSQTVRVKSGGVTQLDNSKQSNLRSPLASMFKDPPVMTKTNKSLRQLGGNEKTDISSTRVKPSRPATKANTPLKRSPAGEIVSETAAQISPNSSESLRETLAKAKAAHRAKQLTRNDQSKPGFSSNKIIEEDQLSAQPSTGVLRKRVRDALVSGFLNVAALGLKEIPSEITNMYEPGNSAVNWSEMVDLTKFNAADNQIESIEESTFPDWSISELEEDDEKSNQFGGLELLDLHNNLLQILPIGIRRLQNLTILNLNGNNLSNSSLSIISQLSSLKELYLAKNNLSGILDFDEAHLPDLHILDLHDNQIQQIAGVSHFTSLQKLNLASNVLNTLPWETLRTLSLVEVNISRNQLHGVLFDVIVLELDKLQYLDASYNSLEAIMNGEIKFPSLQILVLSGNKLRTLPDTSFWSSLVSCDASENQLNEIPPSFSTATFLKHADFSHNNIKNLDANISRMENLTSLNIAGNPLRDRKFLTMTFDDVKSNLQRRLDPGEGLPTSVMPSRPNTSDRLEPEDRIDSAIPISEAALAETHLFKPVNGVLDLSSRNLATIHLKDIDLTSTSYINTIRLSNNDLTDLPFDLLSHPSIKYSLRSLDLSHSPVLHPTSYVDKELFLPKLQSLYIVSTGLTSLDALTTYLKAPELREINISCHRLTGHVPWVRAYFPACTTLLATDNWFSSIDVEGVRGLEVLDVRNNEIGTLPPKLGLLGNHTGKIEPGRLKILEVSGNRFRVPRISTIEKGVEAVLKDLRRMVPAGEMGAEWEEEM